MELRLTLAEQLRGLREGLLMPVSPAPMMWARASWPKPSGMTRWFWLFCPSSAACPPPSAVG